MTVSEIARHLAINSKASGIKDYGDLFDENWDIDDTSPEWAAACDLADQLKPSVAVPQELYAAWARVNADHYAEISHEQRQLGCD